MGVAAVKIKIMPVSPDTDLEKLKENLKQLLDSEEVKGTQFEIQPIAFGLKAIIMMFGWPEEKELDALEERFKKVPDVNSVELLDIRRAIG